MPTRRKCAVSGVSHRNTFLIRLLCLCRYEHLEKSRCLQQIAKFKRVFREPQSAQQVLHALFGPHVLPLMMCGKKVDAVLSAYSSHINSLPPCPYQRNRQHGAMMLCVVGGKLRSPPQHYFKTQNSEHRTFPILHDAVRESTSKTDSADVL